MHRQTLKIGNPIFPTSNIKSLVWEGSGETLGASEALAALESPANPERYLESLWVVSENSLWDLLARLLLVSLEDVKQSDF